MGIYTSLVLEEWVEKAFYHSLRTNGFVILAGQTGTGKTRLFHEFKVYESDEFIWLLKKVYDNDNNNYWTKIMDLRNWIINEFGKNLTLEKYLLPSGSSKDFLDTFTAKLRGTYIRSEQKNKWIKDIIELGIEDFGLRGDISSSHRDRGDISSSHSKSGTENRYYLSEKLVEYFPDCCDPPSSDVPEGVRRLRKPYEFFNDVMKGILKDLIQKIENRDIIGIKNDKKLKEFFSTKALKLLAFIADPCRYWEIFDENEIEEIKQRLYKIYKKRRTEEEQSQGLGERLEPETQNHYPEPYHLVEELCEGEELNDDCPSIEKLFFPIRPDFTEPHHLVGYYNPIDKKYYPTELVRFILKAIEEYLKNSENAQPYLVLFDEMNIAQVEYYFADFLSVLESPRIEDVSKYCKEIDKFLKSLQEIPEFQESWKEISKYSKERFRGFTSKGITLYNIPEKTVKLLLPPNLYFVGTVNMDETTRSFSPKVLDRAFVIEFDSDLERFIEKRYSFTQNSPRSVAGQQLSENSNDNQLIHICKYDFTRCGKFFGIDLEKIKDLLSSKPNIKDTVKKIYKILKQYGLHFGYRTFEHVMMFIVNTNDTKYENLKIHNPTKALDIAIYTKILPKISGARYKLEALLSELLVELCDTVVDGENNSGKFKYKNNQLFWEKLNPNSQSTQDNSKPVTPVTIETLPEKENNEIKVKEYKIKTEYPLTVKKIFEMLYRLQKEGFTSFL